MVGNLPSTFEDLAMEFSTVGDVTLGFSQDESVLVCFNGLGRSSFLAALRTPFPIVITVAIFKNGQRSGCNYVIN